MSGIIVFIGLLIVTSFTGPIWFIIYCIFWYSINEDNQSIKRKAEYDKKIEREEKERKENLRRRRARNEKREYEKERERIAETERKSKYVQAESTELVKYADYITSNARYTQKDRFMQDEWERCEICEVFHEKRWLTLHHKHYDTVWNESRDDLWIICHDCHNEVHFKNWHKVNLSNWDLLERFNYLKNK